MHGFKLQYSYHLIKKRYSQKRILKQVGSNSAFNGFCLAKFVLLSKNARCFTMYSKMLMAYTVLHVKYFLM